MAMMNLCSLVALGLAVTCGHGQRSTGFKIIDVKQFNKQYQVLEDGNWYRSLPEVTQLCKQRGASVVQPKSRPEVDIIDKHIHRAFGFYIGVQTSSESVPTKYADGTTIKWFDWFSKYRRPETSDCVGMYIVAQSGYRKMDTMKCDSKVAPMAVVCEKTLSEV